MRTDLIPFQKFKIWNTIYIAVPSPRKKGCTGCAFDSYDTGCFTAPFCGKHQRPDNTDVIYIKENVK